uniref:Uncharacterized protein n=1 Tax=Rhizophora mucronata TaxID=61149 RepID=A0A2P2NQL5_RHIMU
MIKQNMRDHTSFLQSVDSMSTFFLNAMLQC